MGRMGITHFSIINSHPSVEIVAVADTSGVTLDLLKKYIPSLGIYKDYKELITSAKPDAIIVCTPPNLHYEICEFACANNIHAFVEKPFTTDVNEANKLKTLFEEKGLVNQVGYVNRFNDLFIKAKNLVRDNVIGKVIRFRSEMFSCTVIKEDEGSGWRAKRENGGGAVYEMAAHAIDLVNYIVGMPDKVIGSSLNKVYSKNVEDIVSSTFVYNNGLSGTLYVNWSDPSYRKPSNKLEILGTQGKLLVDQHGMKIFMNEDDKNSGYRKGWNSVYITDVFTPVPFYVRGNEFTRQLYHFADSILKKEKGDICTFRDAGKTQEIIHWIFSDYETNSKNL